ncbi:Cyclic nucleotide-gated channel subunit beta 1 [Balamuthia mandrillaris]
MKAKNLASQRQYQCCFLLFPFVFNFIVTNTVQCSFILTDQSVIMALLKRVQHALTKEEEEEVLKLLELSFGDFYIYFKANWLSADRKDAWMTRVRPGFRASLWKNVVQLDFHQKKAKAPEAMLVILGKMTVALHDPVFQQRLAAKKKLEYLCTLDKASEGLETVATSTVALANVESNPSDNSDSDPTNTSSDDSDCVYEDNTSDDNKEKGTDDDHCHPDEVKAADADKEEEKEEKEEEEKEEEEEEEEAHDDEAEVNDSVKEHPEWSQVLFLI